MSRPVVSFAVAVAALLPTAGFSQSRAPEVVIDRISSTVECRYYASYWGDWILALCNRQFPELRERLRAAVSEAFAASSSPPPRPFPATVTVSAMISGMTSGSQSDAGRNFCISDQTVSTTLDWTLNAGTGPISGTAEKTVEIGSRWLTGSGVGAGSCELQPAARAAFDKLQTEVARTAARSIALRYNPMRVTAVDSRGRIQLNYGNPVLSMGSMVMVGGQQSFPTRYEVVTAGQGFAWAQPYGSRGDVAVGDIASVIETDSPEANARRTESVPLP